MCRVFVDFLTIFWGLDELWLRGRGYRGRWDFQLENGWNLDWWTWDLKTAIHCVLSSISPTLWAFLRLDSKNDPIPVSFLYLSSRIGTFYTFFCIVIGSFVWNLFSYSLVTPSFPALCFLPGLIWKFYSVLYQACLVHFSMFYHRLQFEKKTIFFKYSIVNWMLLFPLQQLDVLPFS